MEGLLILLGLLLISGGRSTRSTAGSQGVPAGSGGTSTPSGGQTPSSGQPGAGSGGVTTPSGGSNFTGGGGGGVPASGGGAPASGGGTPASGGGAPASGGGAPASGGGAPASGGGAPTSGGGAPTSGGGVPASGGGEGGIEDTGRGRPWARPNNLRLNGPTLNEQSFTEFEASSGFRYNGETGQWVPIASTPAPYLITSRVNPIDQYRLQFTAFRGDSQTPAHADLYSRDGDTLDQGFLTLYIPGPSGMIPSTFLMDENGNLVG